MALVADLVALAADLDELEMKECMYGTTFCTFSWKMKDNLGPVEGVLPT